MRLLFTIPLLLCAALTLTACEDKGDAAGDAPGATPPLGAPLTTAEGPTVGARFVAFADGKARVMIENRKPSALKSVRVRFNYTGADGEPLMTATGRPQTYPVQMASGALVGAEKQLEIDFPLNKKPEGAAGAEVVVESAKFADDSTWEPGQ